MKQFHVFVSIVLFSGISFFQACTLWGNEIELTKSDSENDPLRDTSIAQQKKVWIADTGHHYIFLTWDDAPHLPGTRNCRQVFKEKGVKASFFVVGMNLIDSASIKLIDSIRKEYPFFLVANHGYSHAMNNHYQQFFSSGSIDSATRDFLHNEQLLHLPVKIIRLPGHNSWGVNGMISGQLQKKPILYRLDSLGYQVIGWDAEWRGSSKTNMPRESATEMAQKVVEQISKGKTRVPGTIVILSHDRFFSQPDAVDSLRAFIKILQSDPRNHFETIDRYPELHRIRRLQRMSNQEN